jgi:hypothetical protein
LLILVATVAIMGLYALRLKRRAEQLPVQKAVNRPVAPPVVGKSENLMLYVADDTDGLLHMQLANIALPAEPSERALQVMRALIAAYEQKDSHHPLAEGADVNAVFLVAPNTAIVDVNGAFVDGHRSGVLVEQLTLASVAQTLAANVPNVGRIKILVDGKERETLAGHADISSFYDVSVDPWPVAP